MVQQKRILEVRRPSNVATNTTSLSLLVFDNIHAVLNAAAESENVLRLLVYDANRDSCISCDFISQNRLELWRQRAVPLLTTCLIHALYLFRFETLRL